MRKRIIECKGSRMNIKKRAESRKLKYRIERLNKDKSPFFEKTNKIDRYLVRLVRKIREHTKSVRD